MSKICDRCSKPHNRKRFCSNACKDRYHNIINPRGFQAREPIGRSVFGLEHVSIWDTREEEMREAAMEEATSGWDEGGWRRDDSGVSGL